MMTAVHSISILGCVPFRRPNGFCSSNRNAQLYINPPKRSVPVTLPHKDNAVSVCGSNSKGQEGSSSVFFDENGVVQDMDGYLDYLSLEYDSVWDTKPSWCQPWTITLTGVLIVTLSWLVLHSALVSVVASSLVLAWWYIFLYAYPKEYADMIAQRRKKVTDGLEDTYGLKKGQ